MSEAYIWTYGGTRVCDETSEMARGSLAQDSAGDGDEHTSFRENPSICVETTIALTTTT